MAALGSLGGEFLNSRLQEVQTQDPLMFLTEGEREAARRMKRAVTEAMAKEASTSDHGMNVETIPDFEFVQQMVVSQDDANKALKRIMGLHHFRQEYDIANSMEDGMASLNSLMEQQPGVLLHFEQRDIVDGVGTHGVFVLDLAALDPASVLDNPRPLLAGFYYLTLATFPHVASVREGLVNLVDSDGVDWGWENQVNHFKVHRKMATELMDNYPITAKKICFYN